MISRTAPYISYTCITVALTLFQKRMEFESQNAYIINVWVCSEILPSKEQYKLNEGIWNEAGEICKTASIHCSGVSKAYLLGPRPLKNARKKTFVASENNMAEHHVPYYPPGFHPSNSRTPSSFHQRSSHSRSASWSYTSGNGQITLTPLNPIRSVIREFVPSFGHRSSTSGSSTSSPLSPLSPSAYVDIAEVLRGENEVEDSELNRATGYNAVNTNSGNSSEGDVENGEVNVATGSPDTANGSGRSTADRVEFQGTISWLEKSLPFVLLLLSRIMWDHRLGMCNLFIRVK